MNHLTIDPERWWIPDARRFLAVLSSAAALLALANAGALVLRPGVTTIVVTIASASLSAGSIVARAWLVRRRNAAVAVLVAASFVAIGATAPLLPNAYASALGPLVLAGVLLPLVDQRHTFRLLALGWAASVALVVNEVILKRPVPPGDPMPLLSVGWYLVAAGFLIIVFATAITRLRQLAQLAEVGRGAGQDAERRLRSLVDSVPVGVFQTNGAGTMLLEANPALVALLAYPDREALLATPMDQLYDDPADRAVLRAALRASREPPPFEVRLRRRDGEARWARIRLHVTRQGHGQPRSLEGTVEDLTQERLVLAQLSDELMDRQAVAKAITSLRPLESPEATADALVDAIVGATASAFAGITEFIGDGALLLAIRAPGPAPVRAGEALPPGRANHLMSRAAAGPWVEEWKPATHASDYERRWMEAGIRTSLNVPIRHGDTVIGIVTAGIASRESWDVGSELTSIMEFASAAANLIGPQLAQRRRDATGLSRLRELIRSAAFQPVFQPIVDLDSGRTIGFEALTRFADGTVPLDHFAEASALGSDVELARATLDAALAACSSLPDGTWLAVNVAPAQLEAEADRLAELTALGRPVVVELSERHVIGDYGAVTGLLQRLRPGVRLAIDDVGGGSASFRHIYELRPEYVKLAMSLVRHVDADPIRQGLVAGLVHFTSRIGAQLVAVGVESEAERSTVAVLGVELGQGYLFGRPAPVERWANRGRRRRRPAVSRLAGS